MFRVPCDAGPLPSRLDVSVLAPSFACPGRHAEGCDYHHRLDLDAGTLELSIALTGAGERRIGVYPAGDVASRVGASAAAAWCYETRDFAPECVKGLGLRFVAVAPDAGVDATWSFSSGVQPAEQLYDALQELLRRGNLIFRDAGTAW